MKRQHRVGKTHSFLYKIASPFFYDINEFVDKRLT